LDQAPALPETYTSNAMLKVLLRARNLTFLAVLLVSWDGNTAAMGAWRGLEAIGVQNPPCSARTPGSAQWISLNLTAPSLPAGFIIYSPFSINRLILDPILPGRIWAATTYGLLRTNDGGASWQPVFEGDFGAGTFAIDPRSHSSVIASPGGTIFTSGDGGNTWRRGTYMFDVRAIAFDPDSSSVVYAGSSLVDLGFGRTVPGAVYLSVDGGETWNMPDPLFQPSRVYDLLITPIGTLIAATHDGVFRSTNQGRDWQLAFGTGFAANGAALDPSDGSIFVSTASNGFFDSTTVGTVLRSTDDGEHFQQLFAGSGLTSIAVDQSAPLNIYAGTAGGVVHSSDGGSSWSVLDSGLSGLVWTLAIDPRTGSVFAGTYSGSIFRLPNSRRRVAECRTPHAVNPRP
jgi:photosystem II stability/assembly factor-like uncharacterized protein